MSLIGRIIGLAISAVFGLSSFAEAPKTSPIAAKSETAETAKAYFEIGRLYETYGRLGEAESAYTKAAAEGGTETATMARERLDRVLKLRGKSQPGIQIDLGDSFRKEGRFTEAETAYLKAVEGGDLESRTKAVHRLAEVIRERESIAERYVRPAWETTARAAIPTAISVVLVLALLRIAKPMLVRYGRRRFRNSVAVTGFVTDSASPHRPDFTAVLRDTEDRIQVVLRGRLFHGQDPKMPMLLGPRSAEVTELLGGIHASVTPFGKWWLSTIEQPAYRISGSIELTTLDAVLRVKLEQNGVTIYLWERQCGIGGLFEVERQIAYQVLVKVKDHAESNAS